MVSVLKEWYELDPLIQGGFCFKESEKLAHRAKITVGGTKDMGWKGPRQQKKKKKKRESGSLKRQHSE